MKGEPMLCVYGNIVYLNILADLSPKGNINSLDLNKQNPSRRRASFGSQCKATMMLIPVFGLTIPAVGITTEIINYSDMSRYLKASIIISSIY